MPDGGDVIFAIQHRLIEVRDAPSLRNVKRKSAREQLCRLTRRRVAPGAEGGKKVALLVKRECITRILSW